MHQWRSIGDLNMAIVLTWQRSTPGQPQYGLTTLTEHYKVQNDDGTQITAADVMTDSGVPQIGDAHPDFSTMFCTDRYCAETGESASALDVTYMGTLDGDLPPQKATSGAQVASASTNTASTIYPAVSTNPATVQFYAITNTLTFYSTDPGDASEPDDPPEITSVITWDFGNALQPGLSQPDIVIFLLTEAFIQGIIETPPDVEPIVEGHYYLITKRKTRTLFPYAPPS